AFATRLQRWTWSLGTGRSFLLHKPQQRPGARRQVLEDHAGGELAHVGQRAARVCVWVWFAQPVRSCRQNAILPDAHTAPVLTSQSYPSPLTPSKILPPENPR